jgi:hypothetical protein
LQLRILRLVVDTVHGPVRVRAVRTMAGRRRLFTVASFGGLAHGALNMGLVALLVQTPCAGLSADGALTAVHHTSDVSCRLQGTIRPVFHFGPPASRPRTQGAGTRRSPSARAAAGLFGLGRDCASSQDAFCRTRYPAARSDPVRPVAVLEMSFASGLRAPFHSVVSIVCVSRK